MTDTPRPRLVLATFDEPLFLPRYLSLVVQYLPQDVEISAVAVMRWNAWRGPAQEGQSRLRMYGPLATMKFALNFAGAWFRRSLPYPLGGHRASVHAVARHYGLPIRDVTGLNMGVDHDWLRRLSPDLMVLIGYPEKLSPAVFGLPRFGCLNVHSSLLPNYRGFAGLYWAMAHGNKETGVSVHQVNESFDAGPVIAQQTMRLFPGDSLWTVYERAMRLGAPLTGQAVRTVLSLPLPISTNTIHNQSFPRPGSQERAQLLQHGYRLW